MELLIYSGAVRWHAPAGDPPMWVAHARDLRGGVSRLGTGSLIALDTPMRQIGTDGRPNGHTAHCLIIDPGDIVVAW